MNHKFPKKAYSSLMLHWRVRSQVPDCRLIMPVNITARRNAPFSEVATESKAINAATTDYLIFPQGRETIVAIDQVAV